MIAKLFAWLRTKIRPVTQIRIENTESSSLTLAEWRKAPEMVAEAKRLFSDPNFKLILRVMHNESPVNYGIPKVGIDATARLTHLGQIEGYHMALNNLEAFAVIQEENIPLESTFAAE